MWFLGQLILWVYMKKWHGEVNDRLFFKGISPLVYWQKVDQRPTQTKPYTTLRPWTAGYSGPDWIIRVDESPTRGSIFWGPRESVYQIILMRNSLCFIKSFSSWTWDSKSWPAVQQLSPFDDVISYVEALVCGATGKRLTTIANLPKLSLLRNPFFVERHTLLGGLWYQLFDWVDNSKVVFCRVRTEPYPGYLPRVLPYKELL